MISSFTGMDDVRFSSTSDQLRLLPLSDRATGSFRRKSSYERTKRFVSSYETGTRSIATPDRNKNTWITIFLNARLDDFTATEAPRKHFIRPVGEVDARAHLQSLGRTRDSVA